MRIHPNIELAIMEAVKAGVFRRAARLNPLSAGTWDALAVQYSKQGAAHLNRVTCPRGTCERSGTPDE